MLELEDIQHFLLTRPRALAARYGFLSFRRPGARPGVARRDHRQSRHAAAIRR